MFMKNIIYFIKFEFILEAKFTQVFYDLGYCSVAEDKWGNRWRISPVLMS